MGRSELTLNIYIDIKLVKLHIGGRTWFLKGFFVYDKEKVNSRVYVGRGGSRIILLGWPGEAGLR